MDRYFELRNKNGFKNGKVINIPENVTFDMVRERIEVNENNESIVMIDDNDSRIDIVFDWVTLDFDAGIDENLILVDTIIQSAIVLGIEDKVVFAALSMVKKDSNLDIVIAMQDSYRNLTK